MSEAAPQCANRPWGTCCKGDLSFEVNRSFMGIILYLAVGSLAALHVKACLAQE